MTITKSAIATHGVAHPSIKNAALDICQFYKPDWKGK